MAGKLKLMCILAHPDDESLGMGGTLAAYAAEGIETYLITATRGERGRFDTKKERPSQAVIGQVRESELREAAKELGIQEVSFLNYVDGELDQADPKEVVEKIAGHLRRIRPQVVLTFGPDGAYGHPDHIAISQFAAAAVVRAADANWKIGGNDQTALNPHSISKLYYLAWNADKWAVYQSALRDLRTTIDGVERRATPWPDWAITTILDTSSYWPTVWRAVSCHQTQMGIYRQLGHLPEEHHKVIWGIQQYYRVFSLVNGGRQREKDLFEGLR